MNKHRADGHVFTVPGKSVYDQKIQPGNSSGPSQKQIYDDQQRESLIYAFTAILMVRPDHTLAKLWREGIPLMSDSEASIRYEQGPSSAQPPFPCSMTFYPDGDILKPLYDSLQVSGRKTQVWRPCLAPKGTADLFVRTPTCLRWDKFQEFGATTQRQVPRLSSFAPRRHATRRPTGRWS